MPASEKDLSGIEKGQAQHVTSRSQGSSIENMVAERPEESPSSATATTILSEPRLEETILHLTKESEHSSSSGSNDSHSGCNKKEQRQRQSSHEEADLECKRVPESLHQVRRTPSSTPSSMDIVRRYYSSSDDDYDDDNYNDLHSQSKNGEIIRVRNKLDQLRRRSSADTQQQKRQSSRHASGKGPFISSSAVDKDPFRSTSISSSSMPPTTSLERDDRVGAPIGVGAHSIIPTPEYGRGQQDEGDEATDVADCDPESARSEEVRGTPSASVGNLPTAEIVDDAEPIMYAENVELDNFRRRLRVFLRLGLCLCLIVIVALLPKAIKQRKGDDDIFSHDPRCAPSSLQQQSVAVQCYCTGSAEYTWNSLTDQEKQLYYWSAEKLRGYDTIGEEHTFEGDDCHAHNQALLLVVQSEFAKPGHDGSIKLEDPELHRQLHILSHLYVSFGGIHWLESDLWYETDNYCHWFGVECDFFHLITHLRFPNNFLQGTIAFEIEHLKWLETLDISNNPGIEGTLPMELGRATSLNYLDVSEGQLTGTIPSEISRLKRLDTLKLGGNLLNGTIPVELFATNGKLRVLDLSRNELTGSLPDDFGRHASLELMDVSRNSLTGTIPTDVQALSSLEVLFLGHNEFSGPIPEQLSRLPVLSILGFDYSGFEGSLPEAYCDNTTEIHSRHVLMNCQNTTTDEDCSCCDREFKTISMNRLFCSETEY